jgi:hypothetical protein
MHFPRYWTIARRKRVSAWGWSDESPDHAARHAAERLQRVLDWLARGGPPVLQRRYGYAERPMREEVLREFRAQDGSLRAAVTRNSYGCLVLNTARLMFVDVDAPEAGESGWLAGLFGYRKPNPARDPEAFLDAFNARLRDWVSRWPRWGWRVYQTRAGLRLLATHEALGPDHAMTRTAFEVFEADPRYRQLCTAQQCFRARLTPKPWRCGRDSPRARWPWANEKAEAGFRRWEAKYRAAAEDYATCKLLGQQGHQVICGELDDLVRFHDDATRADSGLPLA